MAFKWTDALVLEFTRSATMGPYGLYSGCNSLEEKMKEFTYNKIKASDKLKKRCTIKRDKDGLKHYFDSTGREWIIKKESLAKKRGTYTFYYADSVDKKYSVKRELYRDIIMTIEKLFGKEVKIN